MAARTLLFIACLLAFLLGCTHGKVVQSDSILKLNETVINQEMAKVEKGEGVLIQLYVLFPAPSHAPPLLIPMYY